MVERLVGAAGDALVSVVLYGARAHGDYQHDRDHFHLLIVLRELDLEHIARVSAPIRWWLKKKKPYPRLLSPAAIRDSADVFPIEFLDIVDHHRVLLGEDPFAELDVGRDHLRIQCERELREKLMRVQEAFVEADGKAKQLRRLMIESYLSFAAIFRGCLHMLGSEVPRHTIDAVRRYCELGEIDVGPFEEIHASCAGEGELNDPDALFVRYYAALRRAVAAADRFETDHKGVPS